MYDNADRPTSVRLIPNGYVESDAIEQLRISYNTAGKPYAVWNPTSGEGVVLRYSDTYDGSVSTSAGRYLRQVIRCHNGHYSYDWEYFYSTNANVNTFIIYVDAVAEYTYDSSGFMTGLVNTQSGYQLLFYWDSTGRVSMLREYSTILDDIGQTLGFSYGTSNTTIRSTGSDDIYGDADDLLTVYCHDSMGRTSSVYTTDLDHTQIYGATAGQYVGEDIAKAKNSLKSSVQTSQRSSNYLRNGGFDTEGLLYWTASGQVSEDALYTQDSIGAAALTLTSSFSSSLLYQYTDLREGDYSLSLDINTFEIPNGVSVYLKAESLSDSSHSVIKQLPVNEYYASGEYAFASLEFRADPAYSTATECFKITIQITGIVSSSVNVWIDNVMLSKTLGPCAFDMLEAGHFENSYLYSPAFFWSILDQPNQTVTTVDSGMDAFGNVLHIGAAFDELCYPQQIVFQATQQMRADYVQYGRYYDADPVLFTLSGWAKGTAQAYSLTANFCMRVTVRYYASSGLTTSNSVTVDFDKGVTDWQFASGVIATDPSKGMIDQITVLLLYNGHSGTGYFDDISLVRADSGSAVYTYNSSRGNLSSAQSGNAAIDYTYSNTNGDKVTKIVDRKSKRITDYTYDSANRLVTEVHSRFTGFYGTQNMTLIPLDRITYLYDTYGFVESVTCEDLADPTLRTQTSTSYHTEFGSHIFGVVDTETDALGQVTTYCHDPYSGRLYAVLHPDGKGSCYNYDGMGNLVEVLPATVGNYIGHARVYGDSDVEYSYDQDTNRLSAIMTHAGTNRTTTYTFSYDGFGNAEETKVGNRTLESCEYNSSNGKLFKLIYGNGLQVWYVYDELDRISEIRYRQGNSGSFTTAYSYTYSAAGQLYSVKDHETDEVTLYQYNASGKLIGSTVYSDTTNLNLYGSAICYDDQSRVSLVFHSFDYPYLYGTIDDNTSYTYYYNNAGNVSQLRTEGDSISGKIEPAYDNLGRTQTRILDYNVGGNDAFYQKYTFHYLSNGTDTSGRIADVVTEIRKGENTSVLASSTFRYEYDSNGNITKIKDAGNFIQYQYEYDSLGQLIREDNLPLNQSYAYSYDHAGNITEKKIYFDYWGDDLETNGTLLDTVTYTYGDSTWSDLLTSFDGTSILYDSIGNPILIGYNTQLSWKGRQLISYCPDYYHRVDLTYNADGVRTSKTYTDPSGETRHEYILDGTQIVKETVFIDDDEAYCLVYLYDETGAPIGFRYRTPSYAQNVFDGYSFEKNLLGDIIGIWDQNGTKVVSYTYDAWGNVTASGSGATGIGAKNPFRYRGYYYDTETGLYCLLTRYYDPEWCRFISPDSPETLISSETSLTDKNLYAYCDNNPIMRTDDGGEFWHILGGALIGAIAGALTSIVTQAISGEDINWKAVGISAASGAISGAITAACPCMGPIATGIVQGSLSAATYAATEKIAYGRDPSLKDVIVTGVVSGVMAGGAKFLAQKAGVVQCFIAGTLVAAKSGLQPIETIQTGDYVWATDPETGQTELKQVVQTFKNEANELVHIKVNGEEITTTLGHPFWVPQKGWTQAIQLRAGDRL